MTHRLAPAELRALGEAAGEAGGELALIDVREEARFGLSHLFWATSVPLSRIELMFAGLVPRPGTPVVLCDSGEGAAGGGEAERAAERLAECGYRDVAVLAGGNAAWEAAGFPLYSGVNVPSKAFGEFVEHRYHTPSISAQELHAMRAGPHPPLIVDSRPLAEYQRMSIPGGIDCPGAELVYRVPGLAADAKLPVVVNCAGRTRSIIGAQSLINAGLPNPVLALRNGTMGWELAGLKLEHGAASRAPNPSGTGLTRAREAAQRVARRFCVRTVERRSLEQWGRDAESRTVYLLDVRHPEEFEAGHLPGSRCAPGGQLVQATDEYIAVRGARIVLVDDHGIQATMTASWLIQMGWRDVFVLEGGLGPGPFERGAAPARILDGSLDRPEQISAGELRAAIDRGGVAVADLSTSRGYRRGHVPAAWFLMRSRMARDLGHVQAAPTLVLTSEDGLLARVAAKEARAHWPGSVLVLRGGNAAWRGAGLPLEAGEARMASAPEDVFLKPYERGEGNATAMQDYLTWELALLEQIGRDSEVQFRHFPPE
jgi:rhodanese-related sulfurtransferase